MIIAIDTNCILPGQVGGIENYTLALIDSLKFPESPAHKLLLLTRPENHKLFSKLADQRTELVMLDRPTKGDTASSALAEFQALKLSVLQQHHVDLLHCPGNTINPVELNLPVVLNLHDLQHRHFPEYFTADELANREKWWVASAKRADALIAASNFVRDDLNMQLGISRSKIFVTPDVFESAFLTAPTTESLKQLKAKLSLPDTFFLYPAACWPHKNHARLIRAFAATNLPAAQLVLTGGGQEQLAEFANQPGIRLLGRVETSDLIALYHLATAMIFPSQHESWSIPIMEAMACGCPVACSNVTSLPEEIGNSGILFSPDDDAAITASMRALALDGDLRRKLSSAGKQRVKQFDRRSFLKTLTTAYRHARGNFYSRKAA